MLILLLWLGSLKSGNVIPPGLLFLISVSTHVLKLYSWKENFWMTDLNMVKAFDFSLSTAFVGAQKTYSKAWCLDLLS
jgi:hypothetical protein